MSRGAVLVGALLVTIARPVIWPLALATFLLRGGVLVFLIPIVVLPTPAGLGDVLGPALTEIAFGALPTGAILAAAGIAVGFVAIVGLAAWIAAAFEGEAVRVVAADVEVAGAGPTDPMTVRLAGRVMAARLIANIPLVIVLGWGSIRLIARTYAELTSPSDVGTSIVVRVLAGSPEVMLLIGLAWMAGQIVGAIGARRVVLAGAGVARASTAGVTGGLRHPLASLARFWIPTIVLLLVLVPSTMAASTGWRALAGSLADPIDPIEILVRILTFVALWAVGLLLTAVVCAWRSAVWTVADVVGERTFGGSVHSRPGDWRPGHPSATV